MEMLKISFVILSVLVASNAGKNTDTSTHPEVKTEPFGAPTEAPPPPNNSTTATTPTKSPPTKPTNPPTTSTTPAPTTTPPHTTPKPSPPPTSTAKPTSAPPTPDTRKFDAPSFIGGIVLTLGLTAIAFVCYKFYKARTDGGTYHTL